MIKQKKGVGFGMAILITVVAILFGIVAFSPIVNFVTDFIRTGGDSSACALSLYKGQGVAECPPDDIKVSYDEIEIKYGGKEKQEYETFITKDSRTNEGMVREALARLLRGCLSKGGGLKSRSFAKKDGITCLVCATLSADDWSTGADDILRKGIYESYSIGLKNYLEDDNIKPLGKTSDKTYMDLLTKDADHRNAYTLLPVSLSVRLEKEGSEFARYGLYPGALQQPGVNNDYVILYMGVREEDKNFLEDAFNKVAGGLKIFWNAITLDVKYFLGAAFKNEGVYFTYITESSNVKNVCQRIVN